MAFVAQFVSNVICDGSISMAYRSLRSNNRLPCYSGFTDGCWQWHAAQSVIKLTSESSPIWGFFSNYPSEMPPTAVLSLT